jgi:hypothetical protein
MQRLDTLRFALAARIYGADCDALATICALLAIPGFKPFTDLLVQFYGFYGYLRHWRRSRRVDWRGLLHCVPRRGDVVPDFGTGVGAAGAPGSHRRCQVASFVSSASSKTARKRPAEELQSQVSRPTAHLRQSKGGVHPRGRGNRL